MSTITKPTGQVLISVEEFARMQDAGLFEGRHVELLDGGLYEVTKNPPHNYAVDAPAAGAYPAPAILAETESVDLARSTARRSARSPWPSCCRNSRKG